MADPHATVFCSRCSKPMTPGEGNFYVVAIEAVADPTPPNLAQPPAAAADIGEQIDRLIYEMRHLSEQELMDMVHRRLTIYLCGPCYRQWIEDPAGSP